MIYAVNILIYQTLSLADLIFYLILTFLLARVLHRHRIRRTPHGTRERRAAHLAWRAVLTYDHYVFTLTKLLLSVMTRPLT